MPKIRAINGADTYLDLLRRFPLRRLKNRVEHARAVRAFTKTSLQNQDTRDVAVLDYLDLLAELIDQYERSADLKVDTSHATPAEIVLHLMQSNDLTISALARQIGIGQSNLSEMLSGRRDFSKKAIAALCNRFAINPSLFF